ncbi:MAG TPA: aldo/keto reductase [Acidimicrobiia bacterium]|nr:aldo/keto reductase [Acidimicrobiia bacterium]
MKNRILGKTGYEISEVGFGAWAIGGSWGDVAETDAIDALNAALDAGVTFIDTADVYGDGRSERIIAKVLAERGREDVVVATKAGRRLDPHVAEGYTIENIETFIDRSRANLQVDTLDLVQLHCPPTEVYYEPDLFEGLDGLVADGKIRHYGVSVEKVEEAIKATEFPGVATVQIIFNAFRLRPASLFFELAEQRDVGVIARVPLASGLLSGKMSADSSFAADDHRNFNRHGEAFDVGETFSGVPFEVGLEAVDRLRDLVPEGATMAQWALRWILMFPEVSVVIPGAKNADQAKANAEAADLGDIPVSDMERVARVYADLIEPHVHQRW